MAFLMLAGSVWVILTVSRTKADYTPFTKKFLLFISWSMFCLGLLAFIWSLFLATVPTIEDFANVDIPPMTIDPVLVRIMTLSIVIPLISGFILNLLFMWREKNSPQYKAFLEIQKVVKLYEETTSHAIDTAKDAIDTNKESMESIKGFLNGNVNITLSKETSESLKNQFQTELNKVKKELRSKKKPLTKKESKKKP